MSGRIVNNWILRAWLFIALLIIPLFSYAQQIIVTEKGDTLVTLTPDEVRIVNSVFSDSRWLMEKTNRQEETIELLESRIEKADTVILNYSILVDDMKKEMAMKELAWENTTKKKSTKAFWLGGLGGVVIGIIATLILAR